jgi:hypothetical protein
MYLTPDMFEEDFTEGEDYIVENGMIWLSTDSLAKIMDHVSVEIDKVTITILDPKVLAAANTTVTIQTNAEGKEEVIYSPRDVDDTVLVPSHEHTTTDFFQMLKRIVNSVKGITDFW